MNKNLVASFLVAIGCFGFFALLMPQYQAISQLRQTLNEKKLLEEERKGLNENVAALFKKYNAAKADFAKIEILLPKNIQTDEIIASIEAIAAQNGLSLKSLSVSPGEAVEGMPYKESYIAMIMNGSYAALTNLLQNLETNLRLYDVVSLNVSEETEGGAAGSLAISLKLKTYNSN